jgi:predicted RNA binding protein YcfA (HicA-like mRNA interferase family)
MPRKIREVVKELRNKGWYQVPGGKGDHRKFRHDKKIATIIVPHPEGHDAPYYLEKQIRKYESKDYDR